MTMMDIPAIAADITAAIMAGCAPGTIPSHALMLKVFTDVYEIHGMPSDSEHQAIAAQVGARIQVRE
jgi:hypothetical protein